MARTAASSRRSHSYVPFDGGLPLESVDDLQKRLRVLSKDTNRLRLWLGMHDQVALEETNLKVNQEKRVSSYRCIIWPKE